LRAIALGTTLAWFAFANAAGQPGASGAALAAGKRNQMEAAIQKFMTANHVPGASVAVVEGGKQVWVAGFGKADLENSVPATASTLYRLASVSKPITAVGALQLWQRGKLGLDGPVQKYCPGFPQKPWPVTTRELLSHTGGVRHYREGPADMEIGNTKHFDDPIQGGLGFFAGEALVAQPGTEFHYSTQGFTVVGCAIEGASGEKYVDYEREHVFLPAGMTHTVSDNRFAVIPERARFYQKDDSGRVLNADFLDSSYKIPGGGWLSSAEDMARFEVSLLGDRLLDRAVRDLMWTPQSLGDGKHSDYALGWGTGKELGVVDVGHSGSQQGTSTYIMLVPERNAGVVVLMNLEGAPASDLGTELMRLLLGLPAVPAKK
jgi:CubicO group peptidase (beta-lactamase class C family)